MQRLIPIIRDLEQILSDLHLAHAFGGALANNYWGIVRTTQDVDCLISVPFIRYQQLADALESIGCRRVDDTAALLPITVPWLRTQVEGRKLIECYRDSVRVELFVPAVPLQQEMLRRAVHLPFEEIQIPVTTAEDLILIKMAFHRAKDLLDVQGILWAQRGKLDLRYLDHWSQLTLEPDVGRELAMLVQRYADSSDAQKSV